jgi:hypothetical protein
MLPNERESAGISDYVGWERINATPNQNVHTLMRTEAATQRRFPRSIPNHLPRAQPEKDATPETMAIHADHAGTARSELRASFPEITATASAKKAIPLALPSAKAHHVSNISLVPDIAALVTAVASATAVVMVQRALTVNTAHAVMVHQPPASRDPEVSTISPVTAYRDKEAADTQWITDHRIAPSAILFI